MKLSLASGDHYEVEHQAHALAGACDMLGFVKASNLLRQLEQNAKQGTIQQVPQLLLKLDPIMIQSLTKAETYCS